MLPGSKILPLASASVFAFPLTVTGTLKPPKLTLKEPVYASEMVLFRLKGKVSSVAGLLRGMTCVPKTNPTISEREGVTR
jgi:hypothetical protein